MVSLNVSEPGATVERISYGERIILRPDPVPMDRGYEKGTFHFFKYSSFFELNWLQFSFSSN